MERILLVLVPQSHSPVSTAAQEEVLVKRVPQHLVDRSLDEVRDDDQLDNILLGGVWGSK